MRAYDRADHSNDRREAPRRTPRAGPAVAADVTGAGAMDAAQVLALQRTVGNAAVASVLSGQMAMSAQRATAGSAGGGPAPTGNRGSVAQREREMSVRHGIRIGPPGPGGEHFTHALLDKIDSALSQLPEGDVGPNERLLAIEMDPDPEGSASLYNAETRSIRVVRPALAGALRAPAWLYASLNRGSDWQRRRMDQTAMADYEGISPAGDRALDIPEDARHVMGPQGNLVKWTIRHEVGHAVDEMTGWERNLAREDRFGGWQTYRNAQDRDLVAGTILRAARLDTVLPPSVVGSPVSTLSFLLNPRTVRETVADGRLGQFFDRFEQHLSPQDFAERKARALHFIRLALAQPWTLDNGGADILDVDSRTYQMDQYGTWVSYSSAQRGQYKVSNYQFSSPVEWFAEAYATYYDRKRLSERAKIHPGAREWFETLPRPAPQS